MKAAAALTLALAIRALPGMAEPVLIYDVTGARAPDAPPLLSIEPDGSARMRGAAGTLETARIDPVELDALLARVADLIVPPPVPPAKTLAVGAGLSRITVETADGPLHAELRESAFTAATNPENADIARFRKAEILLIETLEALRAQ